MNDNPRLLLSLVIDNSASMKGERFDLLKNAIDAFQKDLNKNQLMDRIQYSITIFDGLKPKIFKNFGDNQVNLDKLFAGGIPVFSKSIEHTTEYLEKTISELDNQQIKYYKPFLVVLMDGINFGDLTNTKNVLQQSTEKAKFAYFPFLLSNNHVDESLQTLFKFKWPLSIIQNKYDALFNWLFLISKQRVETAISQSFTLDPKLFDGWVKK